MYTRDVLYVIKGKSHKDMPFQINDRQPFLKRKRLGFTFKRGDLKPYSPSYVVGDMVRVKTRKEFKKHFLIKSSAYTKDSFEVPDVHFGFSWEMSKFCGKTFRVTEVQDDRYFLDEMDHYCFHPDMFIKIVFLYKEV
jgi:hypothetical protein